MIQGSNRSNSQFFLSGRNLGSTMLGSLKDSIVANAQSMLRFMPPQDAIQLGIEVQGVHAVGSDTEALLESKAQLDAELAQYRANHEASKAYEKSQAELIAAQKEEIKDLRARSAVVTVE